MASKTIPMNMTQINYFKQRLKDIKQVQERNIREQHNDSMLFYTKEEKVGMLLKGEATLKDLGSFSLDECQRMNLLDSFDFPGSDVIDAKNRDLQARRNMANKRLDRRYQQLIDKFVLRSFKTEDEVDAVLEHFKDHDFWKATEKMNNRLS